MTPTSSASETPANSSSSAAASAATASCAQPGSRSKSIPGPNAAAGLDDSPANTRAEPGWPGPRRPELAASTASSSSAAASSISASSSSVSGGEILVILQLRPGRLVVLAGPVQPAVPFRVAIQPGQVVWPGVRGNRRREHEPRPFGRRIVLSNMIAYIAHDYQLIRQYSNK